jgi:hypothetical protein
MGSFFDGVQKEHPTIVKGLQEAYQGRTPCVTGVEYFHVAKALRNNIVFMGTPPA